MADFHLQEKERIEKGQKGLYLSIVVYVLLSIIKIGTGLYTSSQALMADGWNNTSDVFSSLAILTGLIISKKPADHDHRYGHYRAQTAAALIAALLMAIVGINVFRETILSFMEQDSIQAVDPIAMYVAGSSAVLMYFVYLYNLSLARKTKNLAVLAAAYDNRSDAMVSAGALIGILLTQFGLGWADPIVALVVGGMILKTAWDVGYEAIHSLMDGFDVQKLEEIEQRINRVEGIREVLEIRARYHGSAVHVDATIGVDHDLTVAESHWLTERVEEKLIGYEGIERVYVHVEPVGQFSALKEKKESATKRPPTVSS
ncbi:cation diffusion facilitator family transporter [Brevibacillus sp. SYSU BS000544]|uniref:cation diffusion facilitator family transporter n=1 Tax=Brevibacillus sp. SYSU BS000544 TaxID=3416443 RepID=UPI003CE4C85A